MLYAENFCSRNPFIDLVYVAHAPPNHHGNQHSFRDAGCFFGPNNSTIFQNSNAITDFKNFFQAMRDINHRDAVGPQFAEDFIKCLDFLIRKKSCWFVEDNQFGMFTGEFCNCDHHLLADGQLSHFLSWVY